MEFPTFKNEFHKPGIELLPHRAPFLFVDELMRITINFKREYRRTLAERLENKSLELIDYIVLANSSIEHRATYLQQFTVS